jgi:hypothetical protein
VKESYFLNRELNLSAYTKRRDFLNKRLEMLIGDGPFQILKRINDTASKIKLSCEYDVNATFNIYDLSLFDAGDNSWMNHYRREG